MVKALSCYAMLFLMAGWVKIKLIDYSFFNLGARRGGFLTPRSGRFIYKKKTPGTRCIGSLVSPRIGLDRCGKSRNHKDSILRPSSPSRVALPTELSQPPLLPAESYKICFFTSFKECSCLRLNCKHWWIIQASSFLLAKLNGVWIYKQAENCLGIFRVCAADCIAVKPVKSKSHPGNVLTILFCY